MTIFAVVAITDHGSVDETVPVLFPQNSFHVAPGHWLVNAMATSQDISNRVGFIPGQNTRTGMVYSISGYFGIANPQAWEWLVANWNLPGG